MEKKITAIAIVYFVIGLIVAITFATFYHWPPLSYFSPNFYSVVLTWPFQLSGLISDFQYYGFAGKPF
ncbi:MAG: hypothetical protein PHQ59_04600 [Candidatus Daviesbacteria bacterium]|nr:hypothetical protein [Candidatus Daviesbacteria bacterium]